MKLLRTLLTDMRERQILPAVVVLAVLALAIPVAAPIVLGKVTAATPIPAAPAGVKPAKGVVPPVQELTVLSGTAQPQRSRSGTELNPFAEQGGSATGSSSTTTPPKVVTPTKTTPPKAVTPTKTTPPKSTTTKPKSPSTSKSTTPKKATKPKTPAPTASKPKSKPKSTKPPASTTPPESQGTPATAPAMLKSTQAYTVDVTTNDAKGTHQLKNIVRLAPLPAAQSPELIFLGVLKGGKKAVFLFTNAIQVSGGSSNTLTCLPDKADCQIIELAPGQGMKLAPTSNTALIATFTFEVASIGVANYSSASAAKGARDAVSSDGQTLLPLAGSTELGAFHFDDAIGALTFQPYSGATGATGSTGSSGPSGAGG